MPCWENVRAKNPFKVIDIFEAVYKRESSARLLYVGTGELEDEIKAYTKEKGIEENVFFLGLRNDVEDILQMADVFTSVKNMRD